MGDQKVTAEQLTQPQHQDVSPDTVIGLAERCTRIHSPTPLQHETKQGSSSNAVGSDSKPNAPSDHEEGPNPCEQKMVKLSSPEAETLADENGEETSQKKKKKKKNKKENKCHDATDGISG